MQKWQALEEELSGKQDQMTEIRGKKTLNFKSKRKQFSPEIQLQMLLLVTSQPEVLHEGVWGSTGADTMEQQQQWVRRLAGAPSSGLSWALAAASRRQSRGRAEKAVIEVPVLC